VVSLEDGAVGASMLVEGFPTDVAGVLRAARDDGACGADASVKCEPIAVALFQVGWGLKYSGPDCTIM
jgi:hypothetical protein